MEIIKELEKKISEGREEWIKTGISIEKCNRKETEKWINRAYRSAGMKKPQQIFWLDSPLAAMLCHFFIKRLFDWQLNLKLGEQLNNYHNNKSAKRYYLRDVKYKFSRNIFKYVFEKISEVIDFRYAYRIESNIEGILENRELSRINNAIRNQVGCQPRKGFVKKIEEQINEIAVRLTEESLSDNLMHKGMKQILSEDFLDWLWTDTWKTCWSDIRFNEFCYGSLDVYTMNIYKSLLEILKVKDLKRIIPLIKITENCGWWLPLRNMVIASEKPCEIHLKDNSLHKDGCPALVYPDGFSVWALNGVSVSKEIAETPWNKLDGRKLLIVHNSEERREIVRKIGIEKACEDLQAECIDKWENYELLLLKLNSDVIFPYLKMKNPSIGTYHIEGVHPDCDTVEKALRWRNSIVGTPKVLT